jgi:hypothetical protein
MMTATTKRKDQCHWQNPMQRLAALPRIDMVALYFGEKAKPLLNMCCALCNRIYVSHVVVRLDTRQKQKVRERPREWVVAGFYGDCQQ